MFLYSFLRRARPFRRLTPTLFLFCAWSMVSAQPDRINGRSFATRSPVIAEHAMVASSHPLATQIGLEVLRDGGSAVDAAIAVNAALALMEPTGCGLGGDLFAIVWDAEARRLHGLNGSGRSPRALTVDIMREALKEKGFNMIPSRGVLPVSVPGCVDAWFTLHAKFGKLPMKRLLQPTIDYAREGFPLTQLIAYYWAASVRILGDQPGTLRETFAPGGIVPKEGERFRNPDLAHTLELIAEGGRDAFYEGAIAEAIDAFMRENGGFLRREDLAAHRSEWVEPVSVRYRGYDVFELPPNTQGIAALQMLNILEGFPLHERPFGDPQNLHWMIEAKKLAFEDRARFYADPSFSRIPLEGLLSKEYAAERRSLIQDQRAARRIEAGHPPTAEGDTVYLCTADTDGNMVSLIQSNYRGMGSGVVVPGTGFGLQNRGEMFTLQPDHPNTYAPGKRPFQTIIPAFALKDGQPWLAFGVMGGAMQPQGHVQILVNLIDHGMNVQEAGDAPRWQHLGSTEPTGEALTEGGGQVEMETAFSWETLRQLRQFGHRLTIGLGGFGGYQAILRDPSTGFYHGASESRKDGQAAGF
jgi:gamma-glutamyltranspeptidase / glutathione hydrolase